MNNNFLITGLILLFSYVSIYAVNRDNYGTEVATQLVERANALFNKGKYADAKVLYNEALSTGDSMYTKICNEKIKMINTLINKEKPSSTIFSISQDTDSKLFWQSPSLSLHLSAR